MKTPSRQTNFPAPSHPDNSICLSSGRLIVTRIHMYKETSDYIDIVSRCQASGAYPAGRGLDRRLNHPLGGSRGVLALPRGAGSGPRFRCGQATDALQRPIGHYTQESLTSARPRERSRSRSRQALSMTRPASPGLRHHCSRTTHCLGRLIKDQLQESGYFDGGDAIGRNQDWMIRTYPCFSAQP